MPYHALLSTYPKSERFPKKLWEYRLCSHFTMMFPARFPSCPRVHPVGLVTFSCTFVPMALYAAWRLLDARRHIDGALAEQEELALQGLVQMRLGWG